MKRDSLFIRDLPPGLKKAFRAKCTVRGQTMREVVEKLMRLYVRYPAALEGVERIMPRVPSR